LNSKCEISSLAKRRLKWRPLAAITEILCVCVCVFVCKSAGAEVSAALQRLPRIPKHEGRRTFSRFQLQCLLVSLSLFLSLLVSLFPSLCLTMCLFDCLIRVYATFMLINTFIACPTAPFICRNGRTRRSGNCQFGLNFNWPI